MMKLNKEMRQYLLSQRRSAEYHMQGQKAGGFWQGYYQGKLDQIDFTLRFATGRWHKQFGGVTEKPRLDVRQRLKQKCRYLIRKVFQEK